MRLDGGAFVRTLVMVLPLAVSCSRGQESAEAPRAKLSNADFSPDLDVDLGRMSSQERGLLVEDLLVGSGAEAAKGNAVTVHYTGWLPDGTKFDSSIDRDQPYVLDLPGSVIDGWNVGLVGMRVGGRRRLIIPSHLGYGSQGNAPAIPPYATLVFEIELLDVQ